MLPSNQAVEDLINRDDYLETVNGLLEHIGHRERFTSDDVPSGTPIAKAFTDWTASKRLQAPGKVEVAYALLRRDVRLAAPGKRSLTSLHKNFTDAFRVGEP